MESRARLVSSLENWPWCAQALRAAFTSNTNDRTDGLNSWRNTSSQVARVPLSRKAASPGSGWRWGLWSRRLTASSQPSPKNPAQFWAHLGPSPSRSRSRPLAMRSLLVRAMGSGLPSLLWSLAGRVVRDHTRLGVK